MTALLQLLAQIAIPTILSFIIGKLYLASINKNSQKKEKLSTLNSKLGLWRLPLFWIGISYPIFLFISFGLPIWITRKLEISPSGYAEFISISTLPAVLLASIIPITAAISRAYTTHQTADQIERSIEKNNIEIYLKYKEEYLFETRRIEHEYNIKKINILIENTFTIFHTGNPKNGIPKRNTVNVNRKNSELLTCQDLLKQITTLADSNDRRTEPYKWAEELLKLATCLTTEILKLKEGLILTDDIFYDTNESVLACNFLNINLQGFYLLIDACHSLILESSSIYNDYNPKNNNSEINIALESRVKSNRLNMSTIIETDKTKDPITVAKDILNLPIEEPTSHKP